MSNKAIMFHKIFNNYKPNIKTYYVAKQTMRIECYIGPFKIYTADWNMNNETTIIYNRI